MRPRNPPSTSNPQAPPPRPLYKQHSWSPDTGRDEAWTRRQEGNHRQRRNRRKSVTDDDLDELRGCIDLGFGFGSDSPDLEPKLSRTLPALGLYCAVNKQYGSRLPRSSSISSVASEGDAGSPSRMFDQGEDSETVKTRLKQWAQVVACSVRQFSGEPN